MVGGLSRSAVETALERLLETLKAPRVLLLHVADREVLEQAVRRARAQLLDTPEPILTVVLAGGTGAGKSTLINALAQAEIAEISPRRPTTTRPCIYHHHEVPVSSLAVELTAEAVCLPHTRESLRSKVIVDTPDLDSFAAQHRAATRALLKAAGLVLYVFSPQNYRDERTWSVLREEQRFSACAAVLNKVDLVTPEDLEAITDDLRRSFARLGLPNIRLFRTAARAHTVGDDDAARMSTADADDLLALRAFLEQELQRHDIARLLHRQQARVLAHLQAELDRVAPPSLLAQLDETTVAVAERLDSAATQLYAVLIDHLALAEADLAPRAILRQHERFRGPFRTWLAVTDMLRFGLPAFVRRSLNHPPPGGASVGQPLMIQSRATAADLLRDEAQALQSLLYTRGLPIERWRSITVQADESRLLSEIAATFAARFEAAATASNRGGGAIIWLISTLGRLVPMALILIGLYVMGRDLLVGDYLGLPLLGHLFSMLILTFLILQSVATLCLPAGYRRQGSDLGRQAISEVLTRTVTGWISAYRSDLEADLEALRAPLAALQSRLSVNPVSEAPARHLGLPEDGL
jgi:energy-coupling factor transporter ATP-binding protein EcfA2